MEKPVQTIGENEGKPTEDVPAPGDPPPPAVESGASLPPGKTGDAGSEQKDACQYAVGLSEKFLTISAAGIAFVIGLVFAKESSAIALSSPNLLRAALILFGISVLFGWLFLMNVVGDVAENKGYSIYYGSKQWFSLIQIITALLGILVLGCLTFQAISQRCESSDKGPVAKDATKRSELGCPCSSASKPPVSVGENGGSNPDSASARAYALAFSSAAAAAKTYAEAAAIVRDAAKTYAESTNREGEHCSCPIIVNCGESCPKSHSQSKHRGQ